jgi:hypothetical protein
MRFILLLGLVAAGCGDGDEHNFMTYIECFDHETEEGASVELATMECDEFFMVTHTSNGDCQSDHAADVTAGVPATAITTHCNRLFPAMDGGGGDAGGGDAGGSDAAGSDAAGSDAGGTDGG